MDSKHFSNQLKFIQFLLSRSGCQNVHFSPKKGAESIRKPRFQWRTETIHMGWRCSNQVFQDSAGWNHRAAAPLDEVQHLSGDSDSPWSPFRCGENFSPTF